MANFEKHIEKYRLFKRDAENETVSHMSRIEAYFMASFHLIETVMAKNDKHINKHTLLRSTLTKESDIFGRDTETVWRAFQNYRKPDKAWAGIWRQNKWRGT